MGSIRSTTAMVQPSSIDVRLDRFFRVFNNTKYTHIDPAQQQDDLTTLVERPTMSRSCCIPASSCWGRRWRRHLPDDLAGRLEGKSSLGRLGLLTHSTAGFIDPGFSGHITLELSNVANLPITLWPGMKIGQLCIFRLSSAGRAPVRLAEGRVAIPGPARPDARPGVPQLPPGRHAPLTRLPPGSVRPRRRGTRQPRPRPTG